MAFPILETERLRLVEIEQSYCQKIYEIFSLDEVTCYYGMNSFTEFGQASRMIESFSKNYFEKKAIRWGIVLKKTNTLVGTIGLNNLQLWSKRSEIDMTYILVIGEMVMPQKRLKKLFIMDFEI